MYVVRAAGDFDPRSVMIAEYDCGGTSVHSSEFTITLSEGGLWLKDTIRCLSVECNNMLMGSHT